MTITTSTKTPQEFLRIASDVQKAARIYAQGNVHELHVRPVFPEDKRLLLDQARLLGLSAYLRGETVVVTGFGGAQ